MPLLFMSTSSYLRYLLIGKPHLTKFIWHNPFHYFFPSSLLRHCLFSEDSQVLCFAKFSLLALSSLVDIWNIIIQLLTTQTRMKIVSKECMMNHVDENWIFIFFSTTPVNKNEKCEFDCLICRYPTLMKRYSIKMFLINLRDTSNTMPKLLTISVDGSHCIYQMKLLSS